MFESFDQTKIKLKSSIYTYLLAFVILPVIFCLFTGLLRPLEFACYDLLFLLKPTETVDQRIVLVEWNEESIQNLEESIISDRTLNQLLEIIIKQKPRFIGLDLYRDIPVPAIDKKDANEKAYQELQRTLIDFPNIVGIKKILPPKIESESTLSKNGKITASDLPADEDFRLRRAYIYPNVDDEGNATEIPYIGVVLGYKYLEQDGWKAENKPNGLEIYREKSKISLNPILEKSHLFPDIGRDFLINWRQTDKANNFARISVLDAIDNKLSNNFFHDRLVIIGNTTAYSGDIHDTSITRWSNSHRLQSLKLNSQVERIPWIYGIDVVAQVASSIISAAEDGRQLISLAPIRLEIVILIGSVFSIAAIGKKNYNNKNTLSKLRFITAFYVIALGMVLFALSALSTLLTGMWIDVAPTLVGMLWAWIFINSYYQNTKENRDFNNLRLLLKDFKHNINNISSLIARANRGIINHQEKIVELLNEDFVTSGINDVDIYDTKIGENLKAILRRNENISNEILRIKRYQKRTSDFLAYTYTENIARIENSDLNKILKQTAFDCINQYNFGSIISLETFLDDSIINIKMNSEDLKIIVENLISNSIEAIEPRLNKSNDYNPFITITTKNNRNFIKVIIQDNGVGISKYRQEKIFQPFITFKNNGHGIGLYLVAQIIRNIGGSISLKSQVSVGTKFIVKIPKYS